jgi:hypothetical protein
VVARSSAVRSHLRCVVFFHFYRLLPDPNIRILLTDCWIRFLGPGQFLDLFEGARSLINITSYISITSDLESLVEND